MINYGAEFVDTITEPGPVKILAENKDTNYLESIKRRLDISINRPCSCDIGNTFVCEIKYMKYEEPPPRRGR